MRTAWKAELHLTFRRMGERSVLAERRHEGPLVIQKPLYPEGSGVCHAILVHAPGGIAGGDSLCVNIAAEPGAHALITTPSAAKWYKANGMTAYQTARLRVTAGAILEWLPVETILFDQADAAIDSRIDLDASATYAGWEITCLGRHASGEKFARGFLRQTLAIRRAGRLIWSDRIALAGGDRLLASPVGLAGRHVSGAMVVAAPTAAAAELLDACRALTVRNGEGRITALPEIISARYLGGGAEHALEYFEGIRRVLRPWYAGRPALRPRLWDT